MKQARFQEIDVLRGIAIFAMILIHAAIYFPASKTAMFLWNFSQFAVPFFLFCSFYIFFKKGHVVERSQLLPYIFKRFKRLLIPYWIFLLFYIPLVKIYQPSQMSYEQMLRLITATTAENDMSWLVTLFLMLTALVPFVAYLQKRKKVWFYLYGLLSFASAVALLFYPSPVQFKLIMWLPWSMVIYFTYYFVKQEGKGLVPLFFLTGALYVLSWIALSGQGHSLAHYDNKYPPNLFHISYGVGMILIFFSLVKSGFFDLWGLRQTLAFLSRYSYSLFFIHFLILYVMTTYLKVEFEHLRWWEFFGALLLSSVIVQLVLARLKSIVFRS